MNKESAVRTGMVPQDKAAGDVEKQEGGGDDDDLEKVKVKKPRTYPVGWSEAYEKKFCSFRVCCIINW